MIHATISLPPEADIVWRRIAKERGMTRSAVMRQALGILQVMDDEAKAGRYVGTSRDREALDTVIVSPL